MKTSALITIIALLFVGAAAGTYFLLQSRSNAPDAPQAHDDHHDHDHGPNGHDHAQNNAADAAAGSEEPGAHGLAAVELPADAARCGKHHIPLAIDPFCTPSIVEEHGWCSGHNVAEAHCTRCSPVLIAAFKAEGDWCAEHGLPESQCLACGADEKSSG